MCTYCEGNMSLARGFSTQKDDSDYIEVGIVHYKNKGVFLCCGTLYDSKYDIAVTQINYCPLCGRKLVKDENSI